LLNLDLVEQKGAHLVGTEFLVEQDTATIQVLVVFLLLALILTATVLPRVVCWGVDQTGIYQRRLGATELLLVIANNRLAKKPRDW
jgi:hypothetical protein